MTPDTASRARIGTSGATGMVSSGFVPPLLVNEITRKGANITISATRVVCATMIGSSCAP